MSVLKINMTYQCTAECDHCRFRCTTKPAPVIDFDTAMRCVTELKQLNNLNLVVLLGGEPGLFPELTYNIATAIHELNIAVRVETNAFWAVSDEEACAFKEDMDMSDTRTMQDTRHTRPQHSRLTIGVLETLLPGLSEEAMAGLVAVARERDANVIWFDGGLLRSPVGFDAQANVLYELVREANIDGLIIDAVLVHYVGPEAMTPLCERYAPLPVITKEVAVPGIPYVVVDFYQGMSAAMVHLIEVHGYQHIAFIRGPKESSTAEDRYRAYTEALSRYAIPLDLNLVAPGTFFAPSGVEAVHLWLDERKLRPGVDLEAIVAANDFMALDALQALQARGIRVPEDVAVVGFDNAEQTLSVTPPLTTVRLPGNEQEQVSGRLLLALVDGKDVPEPVILPAELVIRESCGCVDLAIAQASTTQGIGGDGDFEAALASRRAAILAAMVQVRGNVLVGLSPNWAEQLLEAFFTEVGGDVSLSGSGGRGPFLSILDDLMRQVTAGEGQTTVWQNVVSALRAQVFPCLTDVRMLLRAENLWQQARVRIGGMGQRVEMFRRFQDRQQAQIIREIERRLITTFHVSELMDVLAEELPRLGIRSCYLAMYEDPQPYTYPQPVPEWSRLLLAYTEHGRVDLEAGGQRFCSRQLVPDGLFPQERRFTMIVEPLYFREHQLGVVVFEAEIQDTVVYTALRVIISSALQGALLVQSVQQHAHELAVAYEEIRILNTQLQEENLRMSAELDVSRRIQQMVLPSTEELRGCEGLEIVGFMKPADEVGGDYYDVLKENGMIHIGIGDVTGHGLESGVLMLMTQTAIRTLIEHGETDPVVFLAALNRVLYKNIQRMKVDKTLTLAFVNYQHGQIKIIGQHEEMLVVRYGGQVERVDTLNLGFPIGIVDDIAQWVNEATVSLQPGESAVLYTDGITEAENMSGELYGIERLCDMISHHWNQSAEAIKQAVIADVTRHIGNQKVYDDLTLVVLKQR
jgi:serine phosphatase RsbU (regulator of sigma subunit)/DNA-binding LacI/PurR family transcriptional regulator